MTNFPSFAAPSAAPYAPTYNSNRTVPMGDMIDRDAALATIQQQLALWESGTLVCGLDDLLRLYLPQAIAALKPVTQPAPDAAAIREAVAKVRTKLANQDNATLLLGAEWALTMIEALTEKPHDR